MTTTRWRALVVVALLLLGLGWFLGLKPTSIDDKASELATKTYQTLDCGSPWFPNYAKAQEDAFIMSADSARQQCEDAHGATGTLAAVLAALGAATAIGLAFTRTRPPSAAST